MNRKGIVAAFTTFMVLMTSAPAFAASGFNDDPPPTDNGKYVAVIAFFVFVAVVAGMLFIANAYRDKGDH
jgi:hypothetical protein